MRRRGWQVLREGQWPAAIRRGGLSIPTEVQVPAHGEGEESAEEGRADRLEVKDELLARMRRTGRLAREVLQFAGGLVKPGVTTASIDDQVTDYILAHGAYPSPLGYRGFPRSLTTSVNNVLAHGIPDSRPLEEADLVCLDVTVYREGVHGDTADTFALEGLDDDGQRLLQVTRETLQVGIEALRAGLERGNAKFSDMGNAMGAFASKHGFAVNDQFSGHAIDTVFHKPPWILHHANKVDDVVPANIAFTVEPILVPAPPRTPWTKIHPRMAKGHLWKDGWTMSTLSNARAAQAEHTLWVGEGRLEVLT